MSKLQITRIRRGLFRDRLVLRAVEAGEATLTSLFGNKTYRVEESQRVAVRMSGWSRYEAQDELTLTELLGNSLNARQMLEVS